MHQKSKHTNDHHNNDYKNTSSMDIKIKVKKHKDGNPKSNK